MRASALRELVASAKPGHGLAALLIFGGAIWLTLPQGLLPRQAPAAKEVPLAASAPSLVVGQLALSIPPNDAEPTAGGHHAMTAPGPVPAAEPRPAPAAETKLIDPGSRRFGALVRVRAQQPPSVEPAAQTVELEIAAPSGPAASVASSPPAVAEAPPRSSGAVAEPRSVAKSQATTSKAVTAGEARMQISRFLDTVAPTSVSKAVTADEARMQISRFLDIVAPTAVQAAGSLPAAETKLAELAPSSAPASADQPAWLRFSAPAPPVEGRPRIAIVMDDLGLDEKRTERTILLPGPVTLSFLAYAPELPKLSEAARRAGHELLVSVPMEPMSSVESMGPNGLMVGLAHDELLRRLSWNLNRFTGYVGINNHMGSRFTHDAASMAPVMEELRARGLLFLDARTVGGSTGVDVARRIGVPHAGRDVFLDNDVTPGAIAAQLAEVERVARRHGSAIAIGHARDATIEQLDAWLASLPGKDLALVPVSTIVRERFLSFH